MRTRHGKRLITRGEPATVGSTSASALAAGSLGEVQISSGRGPMSDAWIGQARDSSASGDVRRACRPGPDASTATSLHGVAPAHAAL
jgi:hypothetical protein